MSDLLGRDVTVAKSPPFVLERDTPAVVSDYVNDAGAIAALCVTDLRLSNALGAALTMVPASAVESAVQKSEIDATNLENLAEIVNIMARLFNHDDCTHLRWSHAHPVPGELPEETAALMTSALARRDFEITIEEYGAGTLAVYVG